MAAKINSDSKNRKFISRLLLIVLFGVIILTTISTSGEQPFWKWGLIIGLTILLFTARWLIKKTYTEKTE